MKEVAENVYQIPLFPRQAVNAYLVGSVLVDAGVRGSAEALRRAIGTRPLTAHVLTHAHADHQGSSAFVCQTYGVPLHCGGREVERARSGRVTLEYPDPNHPVPRFQQRFWAGPGHPVDQVLREGDLVEDFRVLHTPGHAAGHVALWRERDGVLIAGDVLTNMNLLTTAVGLREPPELFTTDIALNRRSIRRLAALKPRVICFGHGPALHDAGQLAELAARLPQSRETAGVG